MKKWGILLTLVLTSCYSVPQKNYYQLSSAVAVPKKIAWAQGETQRVLWLSPISVADYLAGAGMVYQVNEVKYVVTRDNLWASPLEQQLRQSMVGYLSADLPGWIVTAQPLSEQANTLSITVSGFHGRYDGHVLVTGEWILKFQGKLIKEEFNLSLPQTEEGYEALVETLSQGWQQVAEQIAKEVKINEVTAVK